MNEFIANIIRCPECLNGEFYINHLEKKNEYKRPGYLKCKKCSQIYVFYNNILSLLSIHLSDIQREKKFLETYDLIQDFKVKHEKLSNVKNQEVASWIKGEKEFWDQKRYHLGQIKKISKYSYNRMYVRDKYLVKPLKNDINGKVVLELGGGNGATLYNILNPHKYNYIYINTDISYNALLLSQKLHPEAYLIQCDAVTTPFKPDSFDVIFEFGTLHHLPDNINALRNHIKILKPNGFLSFHDPTNIRNSGLSRINFLKKFKIEQSDHNEYIDYKSVREFLNSEGEILVEHTEYSPIRSWLINLISDRLRIRSKYIIIPIIWIDLCIINTLGRIIKFFKGNSVLMMFKKT
jgi:SAM-dependent methyltransferase